MGTGGQSRLPFLGRNSFRYGNLYNVDLRLSRRIHFGERKDLEFLAEAFNLFNHQIVTNRSNSYYSVYNTPTLGVRLQLQHPDRRRQHRLPRARNPVGRALPLLESWRVPHIRLIKRFCLRTRRAALNLS